ncbi:fumarylacetoacetate hydrolase family protein [soil metagenome]
MKLASYKDGSRDGQLVVVSRDLKTAHYATGVATRLQHLLDDWGFVSPQLQDIYDSLNQGRLRHAFEFDPSRCAAPLPRAYQWVSASSDRAEASPPPEADALPASQSEAAPTMLRGASDEFSGPRDDIEWPLEAGGVEVAAGLAVITGDVPQGASPSQAIEGVRLLALVGEVSLRHVRQAELARGVGRVQSGLMTAFGPVAITPDELGSAWRGGRVQLSIRVEKNQRSVGRFDMAKAMPFHFGELISQLCRTRAVRAGSIVGSGPFGPSGDTLQFGDQVRIALETDLGEPLFGEIDQSFVSPEEARGEHRPGALAS